MDTALVLSAGGMFAAWEAGVWKALARHLQPSLIVGASAGAWNGWVIAGGGSPDELAGAWLDPASARILRPSLRAGALRAKSCELFEQYRPQIPFGLTVTEVPRLRQHLVRGENVTWQHLAATCSIPLIFPPVAIAGTRYVDGGFLGALPLWAAESMGATRVIALHCLTTFPFRAIRAIRTILSPRRPSSSALEVILIEPSEPLGSLRDATVWSAANIARWIDLGERDGHRAASSFTM
jgi:predicted acylesterase/phospholipase RssA